MSSRRCLGWRRPGYTVVKLGLGPGCGFDRGATSFIKAVQSLLGRMEQLWGLAAA